MSKVNDEIASGVHPPEMTYCSFSRSASYHARDLAIGKFPNYTKEDFNNFATIHSICYHLLGLTPYSVFTHKQLKEFAKTFNYHFTEDAGKDMFSHDLIDMTLVTDADYYESFISWQKNMMLWDFDEAYKVYSDQQIELPITFSKRALQLYIERREVYKQQNGLWDFGDMLTGVLEQGLYPQPSCKVFLLDEAQDNSRLLFEVAKLWSGMAERVYIAGDPYQAIYVFAGADPNLMIDFQADETTTLKQTHRCSKAVHELARKLVERFKTRYAADDFIPTESEGIVNKIPMERINFDGGGTTFLAARTRYLLDKHYNELLRRGIPFTVKRGKESPLDKKEKDVVLSLHKLMDGEQVTLTDIYKLASALPQEPWLVRGAKTNIKERAKEEPNHKVSKVSLPALGFTTDFWDMMNDREYLEPLKISPEEKRYFRKLTQRYGRSGLVDEPKLTIGTCHSFKGLECDHLVYDLTLTRLPFENLMRNADEELRVGYVAVTRAREKVSLLLSDDWRSFPL